MFAIMPNQLMFFGEVCLPRIVCPIDLENSWRYRPDMRGRPRTSMRTWVERCATIGIAKSASQGQAEKAITVQVSDPSGRSTVVRIAIAVTHPHFGGVRPWYVCPRCGRRAGKLYAADVALLACRICLGLVYKCQYRKDMIWARCVRLYGL